MNDKNECPDFEELSAWHDQESQNDYAEHIEKCEHCHDIIADLKKMDEAILPTLAVKPKSSAGMQKAKELCAGKPKPTINYTAHIIKIAAVILFAFLLNRIMPQKDTNNSNETIAQVPEVEKKFTIPVMTAEPKKATDSFIIHDDEKTHIPISDFELSGIKSLKNQSQLPIKNDVAHVWISENPLETLKLIENNLPKNTSLILKSGAASTNLEFSIVLKDRELVQLVNDISRSGASLISPELPQPGLSANLNISNKEINYTVSIISKK
jgi:hypothetical protein